jgi:hypothetical protein
MRNGLREIAAMRDEWAGIPMPLEGQTLKLAPRYPYQELTQIGAPKFDVEAENKGCTIRNQWWSDRCRATIFIWNEPDGRLEWGKDWGIHHFGFDLGTLFCSEAWGIEQESNAVNLLGTLVRHHQMKQYLLTGMFMEKSKRSGLTYVFRRLRPTVVLDARPSDDNALLPTPWSRRSESARILTTLCMHPLGYYEGTWAGALTPTDDVVAALMMMRGAEPMYWRRANQIHPAMPNAGL